ncbi:DUF3037 domain-containing protein [Cupriavidus necator]
MTNRKPYSYSILKYVHDVATGEFANVGVALYCHENGFFFFDCRRTLGRLAEIFPDIRASRFKSLLSPISKRFSQIREEYQSKLDLNVQARSLEEILGSVLPKDDSALVWSEVATGRSFDLEKTARTIYARYVTKYDKPRKHQRRSDEDVWRSFRRSLENRNVLRYFDEKVIHGRSDDVKFELAWKNGVWHCVEPVSFDLAAADSIREKAHKCAGQILGVSDSADKFKLYLVLGKPAGEDLSEAFDKAVGILKHIPVPTEIYLEENQDQLADKLAQQIIAHDPSLSSFPHLQ